jgi:hypothetical protein
MSHLHLSLPLALASLLLLAGPATFAAPDKPLNEVIVDVEADGRPVAEVLRKLERDHGLNYVVAQRVMEGAGLVNVHLRQVSLEDALHAICMACGLKLQVRGRILILLPVRGTQPVPAPVRRKRAPEDSSRPKARPARADDFSTRPTRTGKRKESLARSVGEVLGVDVKTGRLQLDADGLKVDFYAPTAKEAGDPARAARMRSTLARLEVGHKVALEYQSVKGRLIIASLVGGTKVRDPGSSLARRKKGETPAKAAPRRGGTARSPRSTCPPMTSTSAPRSWSCSRGSSRAPACSSCSRASTGEWSSSRRGSPRSRPLPRRSKGSQRELRPRPGSASRSSQGAPPWRLRPS